MHPVRVVYLVDNFWPNVGGVEVVSADLLPRLRDLGHDIVVVTDRLDDTLPAEDVYAGIQVRRLPFVPALQAGDLDVLAQTRATVRDIVRDHDADLIHAVFLGAGVWTVPTALKIPLIVSLHGSWPTVDWASPTGLAGRVLASASLVTACSQSALTDLLRAAPGLADRARVVLNGRDPADPGEPLPPPPGTPLLLCVARVTPEKGLDTAVEALTLLPEARLVVAGYGPLIPDLRQQAAELGVEDRVEFLGWVAPPAIASWMAKATVVLVPSRVEGFGLVALEAALASRPVVASRVGGLPEVVLDGETGLLTTPRDASAMAAAVRRLLDDRQLAEQLGRNGRQRALECFSASRHATEWDMLYKSVGSREPVH